jgi:hypothetical protein
MTARYFPSSISCLRNTTSCFVYRGGIGNTTLKSPNREVHRASGTLRRWSVARYAPPGLSEPLQRRNDSRPTESKMTS